MLLHEVTGVTLITILVLVVLGLSEVLKRTTGLPTELTRKFAHIGSGMAVLSIPMVIDSHWTVLVLSAGFAAIMFSTSKLGMLQGVHGVGRGLGGVIWYPITAWALYWLVFEVFEGSFWEYGIPVLVLATADAMGAIVGKSYGRMQYEVDGGHMRSLEGSAAVFGTAFLCVHVPLLMAGATGRAETLLISLAVALAATMLETVSVYGLDNFLVPFGSLFLLEYLLPMSTAEIAMQLAIVTAMAIGTVAIAWRKCNTAGGTVSLLLAMYTVAAAGSIAWTAPFAAMILAFAIYERMSPVRRAHTDSRYALGTAVIGMAVPVMLALAGAITNSASMHDALYVAFLAATASNCAIIFWMLPQNQTFRIPRLRRSVATKSLWQYAPTPGKAAFAAVGASFPIIAAALAGPADVERTIGFVMGIAGLVSFLLAASLISGSHRMCRACGAVTLEGLHCCRDAQLGTDDVVIGRDGAAAALSLSFRETFLASNVVTATCAIGVITWLS